MLNPILGAPAPAPILQRRPTLGAPASFLASIPPVYALMGAPTSGAVYYRVMVMNAAPAPYVARPAGARPVDGVIVPRAFAGERPTSGVLIPRRRAARGPGAARFMKLQDGDFLQLQNGERLRLMEDDYS